MIIAISIFVVISFVSKAVSPQNSDKSAWILIDNFEREQLNNRLNEKKHEHWYKKDTRNDTSPFIENPQVTELQKEISNTVLLKKPAAEGVLGNRKALTFRPLPNAVSVGEISTFYLRIKVEYFPNNHVFGLSNLDAQGIAQHDYNALESSIRITDKYESNGFKNDGTIMVKTDNGYSNIQNYENKRSAKPAQENTWYEIWFVVNNALKKQGGQHYDVYLKGGEFTQQTLVYKNAAFRMKREMPLIYFMMNCNTGPAKQPYGNGGLYYDDLYMAKGTLLTSPLLPIEKP
ncbi:hypothetical protein [Colwellia sp. 1_MG-2023]|uniref:hypothetical protein n=1 Tax=Colwellia sp. 1_MG-2023 TaxID=3062649 RepID=UPI0026E1E868|nr:hypothetical protein [Colwellia sp. 1_MG-2023]